LNLLDAWSAELSRSFGLRAQRDWPKEISAVLERLSGSEKGGAFPSNASDKERVLEDIARRITVGETHFFRHQEQLSKASDTLLERAASDGRRVNVWCSGCASGEEPYSVAMLLHRRVLRRLPETVDILATDLNPDAIERAKAASYTAWSFRGTPSWALNHFVVDRPPNLKISTPELKRAVRFETGSCQAKALGLGPESLDLVLFRNVAIYFEPEAVTALYAQFHRVLRDGALLGLGPSDPRPPDAQFQFLGYFDHAPLYERRRPGTAAAKAAVRTFQVPAPAEYRTPREQTPFAPVHPPSTRPVAELRASVRPQASKDAWKEAQGLADRGETESALRVARTLTAAEPTSGVAHRILGQIELELGNRPGAVAALRQAVFLDPEAALARCFYAVALRESGEPRQALRQLEIVDEQLSRRGAGDTLEDGETRVTDLALTTAFLRGEWR
jgi:chemotaxis protein methyltransferase CheR